MFLCFYAKSMFLPSPMEIFCPPPLKKSADAHGCKPRSQKLLPGPGVKDVEVGVADGRPEGLVRQICRPSCQSRHPPLEVARRRVPPGTGVAIQSALGPDQ
jgi:hypothetical protein